jgi:hypothetical protein
MKRQTALRNVGKVSSKLRQLGGIIGTPECSHPAVRVKRAWVFGSTVKGKQEPNDVDILVELEEVGRAQSHEREDDGYRRSNIERRYSTAQKSKGYAYCGVTWPKSATAEATRFLRAGMKKVSVHDYSRSNDFGDINETKVLIYPRNDFADL